MSITTYNTPRVRRLAPEFLRLSIALATIILLGFSVCRSAADLPVTVALNHLHHGWIGAVTTAIYAALEPGYAVAITLFVAAALWRAFDLRRGLTFGMTVALTWLPVIIFKVAFTRPRPDVSQLPYPSAVTPGDWSFPSGHTAFITAFAIALYLAVGRAAWARWVGIAAVAVVALCPLVNGLHYPSDVAASLCWSTLVAPAVWTPTQAFLAGIRLPARCE